MNNTKLISHLKDLIISNKYKKLIDELLEISKKVDDGDFNNGIIMQAGKLNSLNSDKADGIVGNAFLGIEFAKLKKSLLYYIEQLSDFKELNYQPKNIIIEKQEPDNQETNQETNKMNGKQKRQFDKAFLSAFNSYSALKQMLDYIDIDLDSFSNSSRNLNEVILNIREYGEQNDSIFEIIEGALEEVPKNKALKKLVANFSENDSNNNNNKKGGTKNTIKNKGNSTIIQGLDINGNLVINNNSNNNSNNTDSYSNNEKEKIEDFSKNYKTSKLKRLEMLYRLLDEYENKLLLSENPKEKIKCENEIENTKEQINKLEAKI